MRNIFISTMALVGLADTALKQRCRILICRPVDVAQTTITEEDCGTLRSLVATEMKNNEK